MSSESSDDVKRVHVPAWEVGEVRNGVERRLVSKLQVGDVLLVGGEVVKREPRHGGTTYYLHTVRMGGQTLDASAAVLVVLDPARYATLLRDI